MVSQGAKGISELGAGDAAAAGAEAVGAAISPKQLKQMLTYPQDWGPTEWVSTCCGECPAARQPAFVMQLLISTLVFMCQTPNCRVPFRSFLRPTYWCKRWSGSGAI